MMYMKNIGPGKNNHFRFFYRHCEYNCTAIINNNSFEAAVCKYNRNDKMKYFSNSKHRIYLFTFVNMTEKKSFNRNIIFVAKLTIKIILKMAANIHIRIGV